MAYKKTHDLAVVVEVYQKDGKDKNRYANVGYILTGDDGSNMIMLKRTFNPAGTPNPKGKEHIIISRFEIKSESQPATKPVDDPANIAWSD